MKGEASLGDVIRAWRALGATSDAERRKIARLLNFDLREQADGGKLGPMTLVATASATSKAAGTLTVLTTPPTARGDATPQDLVPFPDANDPPVLLPSTLVALPRSVVPAPLDALFEPNWSRAIASSLTSRMANVGEIDMPRVVARVSQRIPVRRFPRLSRRVSTTEVVTAIDTAGTMSWFRLDIEQLIARLDAVTRAPVSVVRSKGAPEVAAATGGADDDEVLQPLVRIAAGGRVIGLTDLGYGSHWSAADVRRARTWISFAEQLAVRGASVVIVTPVPLDRIPSDVRRAIACVYWDRSSRPAFVHRLLRAHR